MAPAAGLEPATYWLTANRSTAELCRNTIDLGASARRNAQIQKLLYTNLLPL